MLTQLISEGSILRLHVIFDDACLTSSEHSPSMDCIILVVMNAKTTCTCMMYGKLHKVLHSEKHKAN